MEKRKFDLEMEKIYGELNRMIMILDSMIDTLFKGLDDLNLETTEIIRNMDISLYKKVKELESKCIEILLLYSPMGKDLRNIITLLTMLEDLDRMGRYTYDISLEISNIAKVSHSENFNLIKDMSLKVRDMVKKSIDSYILKDEKIAYSLSNYDDDVDSLYIKIREKIVQDISKNMEDPGRGISYILIARYLERMADHAVSMGDKVIYLTRGEIRIHKILP